jgi:hypothetical protein
VLTIASVYRPGGGFNGDYVFRLRDGFKQFCRVPHRFVCLTNQVLSGIERVPLRHNWVGYWSKVELFRPGLFNGPVCYCDLDAMIIGDISDMVQHPYEFVCGTNWKGSADHINSAFMCWDGREDFSYIYDAYDPRVNEEYEQTWEKWGDQGFIQEHLRVKFTSLNELFPGRIVSYKINVRPAGKVPEGASICMFHGRPRPHQLNWELP